MKYRIRFYGSPLGSVHDIGVARKVYVCREVEADTIETGRLDAYRTHEHIHGTILCDLKCATCEVMADPLECKACAGTGWISSARYNSPEQLPKPAI